MSTKKQNTAMFEKVNGWLHSIGPDGRYNRDRIFQSLGIAPAADGTYSGKWGLSDQQRKQVQAAVERELGFKFPGGIEIDPAANINENEGVGKFAKDWKTYAAIGAGLTGVGALGFGPLAGVLGGGSAAGAGGGAAAGAGTTGGTLAAGSIPGLHAALPAAIASQGVSAGIASGAAASAAGVGGAVKGALKTADVVRDVLSGAGKGLGDAADTMGANRGTRLDAAALQEQLDQQRQRNRRDATSDAWRKSMQADYAVSPNRGKTPGFSTYSRNLDLPPVDPAVAAAMRDEARRTLMNDPGAFAFDPKLLNSSGLEKAAGIGSAAAGIAGAIPDSVFEKLGRLIF